jgi:hypothetical protein
MVMDDTVVKIQVHCRPDNEGRQTFTTEWWANNIGYSCNEEGWRGQVSRGILLEKIGYWKEKGKTVELKYDYK